MLLATGGFWCLAGNGLTKPGTDYILSYLIFVVLGIAIMGFALRREVLTKDTEYDNGEHLIRFWSWFLGSLAVSFVCVFLPVAAWPFLPVYIVLGLYSSAPVGVLGATILLIIPVSLTKSGLELFLVYFISGCFGVFLFKNIRNGYKTGLPFGLALGSLLVCETAGTVLVRNARPGPESFVIPTINLIVSGILILGILKSFFSKVIYKYRENYLDLNDPENAILGELKKTDRRTYKKSIHTAYFCERIAIKLGMDSDALKCAGYYHCLGKQLENLGQPYPFPPAVRRILEEYGNGKGPVRYKETAVLMAAESILETILLSFDRTEGGNVDYDRIIDAVFKRFQDAGIFQKCNISMDEFFTMQRIFKEEKLYYDFLR